MVLSGNCENVCVLLKLSVNRRLRHRIKFITTNITGIKGELRVLRQFSRTENLCLRFSAIETGKYFTAVPYEIKFNNCWFPLDYIQ